MLSIIIPTYNEAENIKPLCERIFAAVKAAGLDAELIFVDDESPDGTGSVIDSLAGRYNIKAVHRKGNRGLASAVIEGFNAARGEILCVLDADLSHPPEKIPDMYRLIANNESDFVIASRLVKGGGSTDWSLFRKAISVVAQIIARPLTPIKDLTSGYFMLKRSVIEGVKLNPIGFKIGLEIIAKGHYNRAVEIPIVFSGRVKKRSKLGARQTIEYLLQVFGLYLLSFQKKIRGGA